ncbi:MAG: tetratricopeptide repeat protein [Pseudomonadota bacterium]
MKLSTYCRIKWERSLAFKKKGAFQDAEKELREALEEQPDHPLLNASLAQVYLKQNRLKDARILAESILSTEPDYPQALYVLGEIYFNEDNPEDALRCFRLASLRDPRPYLIHGVVKTLRKMKKYEEALEALDAVPMGERHHVRLLKERALILDRMGRGDETLKIYEKIRELDPDDAYVAGALYRLKGMKRPDGQVIRELENVLKLPSRKDNAQLHGLLGEKLKKTGRLEEAAGEFKKARELAPENLYFLKQEGFCLYRLENYPEAIRLLGEAFRNDPKDYIVKSTLKKMYAVTQNMAGFMELLEDILREHPRNVKISGTLKGLKKALGIKDPPGE